MKNILNQTLLFFVGLLLFILPIGHTIAVRNISILVIIFILVYLFTKYKTYQNSKFINNELKISFLLLFFFTLWMLIVSLFISTETAWSLKEIKSEWIVPLFYFLTFVSIGIYSFTQDSNFQKNLYTIIFLMLFVHILYIDLYAIKYYLETKMILSRFGGLTEGPDKSNYITNILLAFLVSEVIYRFRTSKRILNINNFILFLVILLTILSSVFEGMRNGAIAIVFLGFTGTFFAFYNNNTFSKQKKVILSIFMFILITIPTINNIKNDKRWEKLFQTIPYAIDTQVNRYWINQVKYDLPKLSNGEDVEASAYLRISWGYEGLKLISENPFGIGFGRNAFAHGLKNKYDDMDRMGHSHSGIIDLTIGIGIPGLIIWVTFIAYLMYISYNYFMKYNSFFALVLFFNVTGFFSRFIIDSNMRDHMFQTFMLIIGFSLIFMLKDKYDTEKITK